MDWVETLLETAGNLHWAEVGAVLFGIVYIVLAARENIWCWLFGIVGSALSIYLFILSKLYAESILYAYYVLAGFYGWWAWTYDRDADRTHQMSIITWPPRRHVFTIGLGIVFSLGLAFLLRRYTDAQFPVVDAHTTIFSFIATYLVTRKVLSNWVYWIVIDAISIVLYAGRGLYLYALLMVAYTVIAVYGYRAWRKTWRQQKKWAPE